MPSVSPRSLEYLSLEAINIMCVEEDADTESMKLLQFMRKTAIESMCFFAEPIFLNAIIDRLNALVFNINLFKSLFYALFLYSLFCLI